jgi:hypothetical protein
MLVARTPEEARLYMDLHPCECDGAGFEPAHWLEDRDGTMVAVYEGQCPGCGRTRRFEFALDPAEAPPPPAYGGADPSQIIDPGEFLRMGDHYASRYPADPPDDPPGTRDAARRAMAYAVATTDEVLKFIPPGRDRVPGSAFTSDLGRAMYRASPERFERIALLRRLALFREILGDLTAQ